MKLILLALLLLAPTAIAQTFQVQPAPVSVVISCPSGSATASGNTFKCPGSVPQCPSPPGPGPCGLPPGVINIGQLTFDGTQVPTQGVVPSTPYAYAKVVIPTGEDGKLVGIAILTDGRSTAWRQVTLSQTIGDFSNLSPPAFVQGVTATIYLAIGTPRVNAVTVQGGSTWYVNIRDQLPYGGSSCSQPVCDFSLRAYPPS